MLRNISGAGNLICKLQIEVQLELWVWEPKTKGLDNRGHEDECPSQVNGHWEVEQERGTQEEE